MLIESDSIVPTTSYINVLTSILSLALSLLSLASVALAQIESVVPIRTGGSVFAVSCFKTMPNDAGVGSGRGSAEVRRWAICFR
jgi:hypothetical protein